MKKRFKLVDLDCANCAAKMEDAIKKVREGRHSQFCNAENDGGGR